MHFTTLIAAGLTVVAAGVKANPEADPEAYNYGKFSTAKWAGRPAYPTKKPQKGFWPREAEAEPEADAEAEAGGLGGQWGGNWDGNNQKGNWPSSWKGFPQTGKPSPHKTSTVHVKVTRTSTITVYPTKSKRDAEADPEADAEAFGWGDSKGWPTGGKWSTSKFTRPIAHPTGSKMGLKGFWAREAGPEAEAEAEAEAYNYGKYPTAKFPTGKFPSGKFSAYAKPTGKFNGNKGFWPRDAEAMPEPEAEAEAEAEANFGKIPSAKLPTGRFPSKFSTYPKPTAKFPNHKGFWPRDAEAMPEAEAAAEAGGWGANFKTAAWPTGKFTAKPSGSWPTAWPTTKPTAKPTGKKAGWGGKGFWPRDVEEEGAAEILEEDAE